MSTKKIVKVSLPSNTHHYFSGAPSHHLAKQNGFVARHFPSKAVEVECDSAEAAQAQNNDLAIRGARNFQRV